MAPKAPSHSRQPAKEKEEKEEPSSEEEEEDPSEEEKGNFSDEEEEEGSSEDEGEDQEKVTPTPVTKFGSKSIVQENVGSDSDPDSEGSPSDYKLQPISKSSVVSVKRAHEEGDNDQQSLRSCKKSRTEEKQSSATPGGGVGVGVGGGGITRLWSNEDEIALLNGMIDFRNVKGLDSNADMGAFYDFVKGKLKVDFSRDQLRTKISRIKKRFLNALKKGENGLDPVFSKPHEDMAFELSKKIWGGTVGNSEGGMKGVSKAEKIRVGEKEIVKKEKEGGEQDFWSKYRFLNESFRNIEGNFPSLAMSEGGMSLVKERLSLIGSVKAKELDDKWKQLIKAETELNYKMLALMTEQVKMAFGR
ncbi:STOREKEEPER protein [Sesamum alatum]|uniref:STOREKEEPER protein n=1 Tax=Sesamum alatum TaxID=300844 RepID=A0AAE1XYZ3_9LAMI|nr:STOREKEEPER protein [Sesamum alatum]